ncbi:MAG: Holliday junction branch migration protein RuvA [Candidatus Taylorbacteria bacterium]|nr:Holliday junction branch migration protein RuvA [Candidatus Taylorbacteria bacterium]
MISMISGLVEELGTNYAVINVNGVGYKLFVTADTLHTLKNGRSVKMWTHLAVREDALDLYGFIKKSEQEFFQLLISVSGIGPKSALNILSLASSETLTGAIRTGSTVHLVKISGIGKKTAEKIVMELKDKISGLRSFASGPMGAGMASDIDAIEALRALGYDAEEAREALKKVGKDISDVGAKVKAALKVLG